ncbi:MAG: alpha/beta hydrolase [Candidatus Poribacteria bacterium]|nr:alpha/beta hydrolase [Candidatus Poribacteria bacterium]
MKRAIKFVLIGVGGIIVLVGIAAVYMFWQMGQPLYKFGSVSAAENLRGPLDPPEQTDSSVWRVESDISLHFEVYGKGRPVIIVHGGPGIPYPNAWKGLKSLEEQYAFYYYHQRGAGNSTRPIDRFESKNYPKNMTKLEQTLGIGAQIADIERIRRILKEEKLLLIGHSFGGFIAALYAAEFPEYVEKLILVAPAGMLTPPQKGNNIFDNVRFRIPTEEQTKYDSLVKEYFNFGSIFSKSDADLVDLHTQVGRYLLKGMGYDISLMDAPPTPGGWSTFAVYFSIGRTPDYRDAVANITAPTLILHGDDDDISLNGSREYEEFIPDAKFVSIGCSDATISGHFIFDDCPDQFGEAVREFLD